MFICICNNYTEIMIRNALRRHKTVSNVVKATGCGKSCGSCICKIKEIKDHIESTNELSDLYKDANKQ